jgi:hypothetical protein
MAFEASTDRQLKHGPSRVTAASVLVRLLLGDLPAKLSQLPDVITTGVYPHMSNMS